MINISQTTLQTFMWPYLLENSRVLRSEQVQLLYSFPVNNRPHQIQNYANISTVYLPNFISEGGQLLRIRRVEFVIWLGINEDACVEVATAEHQALVHAWILLQRGL